MGQPRDSGILVPIRDSGTSVIPRSDSLFWDAASQKPWRSMADLQHQRGPVDRTRAGPRTGKC